VLAAGRLDAERGEVDAVGATYVWQPTRAEKKSLLEGLPNARSGAALRARSMSSLPYAR
jgi:hypothetical protein